MSASSPARPRARPSSTGCLTRSTSSTPVSERSWRRKRRPTTRPEPTSRRRPCAASWTNPGLCTTSRGRGARRRRGRRRRRAPSAVPARLARSRRPRGSAERPDAAEPAAVRVCPLQAARRHNQLDYDSTGVAYTARFANYAVYSKRRGPVSNKPNKTKWDAYIKVSGTVASRLRRWQPQQYASGYLRSEAQIKRFFQVHSDLNSAPLSPL